MVESEPLNELLQVDVDLDIINEVAQRNNMGAGGLKGLFTMGKVYNPTEDQENAIREAVRIQRKRERNN